MERLKKPVYSYVVQHAETFPDKTAINFYGNEISYKHLIEDINRIAAYMKAKGIKKGDTVAIYLQNCPQYFIVYYAIQQLGGIVGPCNPMFKEYELSYQLKDLEAVMLITTPDLYPIYEAISNNTNVETVILTSYKDYLPEKPYPEFPEEITSVPSNYKDSWKDILMENHPLQEMADIDLEEDVGLIIYTSGTTGNPKGAMLTYGNSEYEGYAVARNFMITENDVMISVMPVCHIAGKLVGLLSSLIAGSTIVLFSRFSAKGMLQAIEKYDVTFLYTTTPMNLQMLKEPLAKKLQNNRLRINITTSFGIQLTEEISEDWERTMGIPMMEFAYGMSETHTGNTLMPPQQIKYGTVGKPTEGTEILVVDPNDYTRKLAAGEEGMILVKGPSVFKGYKGRIEETNKNFFGEFFITGDMGKVDEEGYLYFLGRFKELIKCSGYSVYPEEVEKMLIQHPAISQAAVIGIPDAVRGESVKAFVVKTKERDVSEIDIINWAKSKMAAYKYPREVEFIEELPQTNSGKVLRRKLKENETSRL
ncbi:class I adenylate-forming enzyme family protein [Lysinibacillus fusiformis]|nr:class I adenylate-forming enzyme family protein [Lysinibacillus fusiformis]